jgi:hypothetical protein
MDGPVGRPAPGVAGRAALFHCAPHDHVPGLAGGHGLGRPVKREAHAFDLALAPGGRDSQGVLDLVQVAIGIARQVGLAAAGEHGQAVDVVDGQTGVVDGRHDGVEGELESRGRKLAADRRLPDAGEDGPLLQVLGSHQAEAEGIEPVDPALIATKLGMA